ncbi:MAG: hypothetical protein K0S55_1298 [Clostridia bacterium]|nr:hypothetical protein [Clostridia bacterium]
MKKIISLLLLMLFILLTACNGNTNQEAPDQEDNEVVQELPEIDMEGYECKVLQDDQPINPFRYVDTTEFSDLALKRVGEVEEAFNCNITFEYGGYDIEIINYVISNVMAQVNVGEIYYSSLDNTAGRIAAGGGLYPLTDVKDIVNYEDSAKWGSANFLETAMFDSIPYAVAPMYWPLKQPPMCYILVVNEDLIQQAGLSDPREFIEQKNWTWETYENFLISVPNELNGRPLSASVENAAHLSKMAIFGNGTEVIRQEGESFVLDINSSDSIEAMDWAMRMGKEHSDKYYMGMKDGGNWEQRVQHTIDGEAVMATAATWLLLDKVMYELDNFGVLPYPVGPKGEQGKWPGVLETMESIGILANAAEPENAAYVIDALFRPLEGYETQDSLDAYMNRYVFHDTRDAEIWNQLGKNAKFSYWTVGGDDFWYQIQGAFFNKTASEFINSQMQKLQNVADKYMIPNLEYMDSHKN